MPALGDEFRSAREARGLSLSDVGEQIHIRSVYLSAIEDEDWASIGAPVYVRGFIRTYARFLGLDGERAVQQFNETVPAERAGPAAAPVATAFDDRERSGPSIWTLVGTIIAVALVAFVGYEWWLFSQGTGKAAPIARTTPAAAAAQPSAAPAGLASGAPSSAPSPSPSPSAAAAHSLALRLTQPSWLRVVVDGKNVAEGVFPAGTRRTFKGKVVDLRVGNAGGVEISANGAPAKTLGGAGDVVEQRYTL